MHRSLDDREHLREVDEVLINWGRWSRGGWPSIGYSLPPTSRDYVPVNQVDKRMPSMPINAIQAEAANEAIVNLAINGHTQSYQIIAAWWAHGRPAQQIAKQFECSIRSVYNYRITAMAKFWPEYAAVKAEFRAQRVRA